MTGRLASWVMNDLRITVFRHLQRLSLDFFTEEKAGVVMSRMTSDIENLQQLLQDGLAQFAIQGLTMVVITVFLFATNVDAGRHHRLRRAAAAGHHVDLVQAGVRARLRQGARRHRPGAGRPLREPAGRAHRHGAQPAALQRRDAPRHRRLATGTPTTTRAASTASTARAHRSSASSASCSSWASAAPCTCTSPRRSTWAS